MEVDRSVVQRMDRVVDREAAEAILKSGRVAHVATVAGDGWPYVIPLVYVYEGRDQLYLHTGNLRPSRFRAAIERDPRLCIEVSHMGALDPGPRFACQSALRYESVIVYGRASVVEEESRKSWFFDHLLGKYGDPSWSFEPGYPLLHKIVLYEVAIEVMTAKRSDGLRH